MAAEAQHARVLLTDRQAPGFRAALEAARTRRPARPPLGEGKRDASNNPARPMAEPPAERLARYAACVERLVPQFPALPEARYRSPKGWLVLRGRRGQVPATLGPRAPRRQPCRSALRRTITLPSRKRRAFITSDPKHPKAGDRSIDGTDLELVDITPDHIARLSKLRDGHALGIAAILGADPAARQRAGLSEVEVVELGADWEVSKRIEEVLPAVEKLLELLHETRLVRNHAIAFRLGEMAHQVRRRADRLANGTEVAAPFEPLLDYHFAVGQKIALAREKNQEGRRATGLHDLAGLIPSKLQRPRRTLPMMAIRARGRC